ncbi:MAG: methionine adenosyltransferase domain-containing protein [bacterium]|nr:methionine adenosyltransferase domain-containing protein [bacterium]
MRTFAEWVLPGHPDKISDRIADRLVEDALARDADALVGIEVAIHRDHVFVDGRIACPTAEEIPVDRIVRDVFRESGYGERFAPHPDRLTVLTDLCLGDFRPEEREIRKISDDQNIVTGYAEWNPATNHLPIAAYVARTFAECLDEARREKVDAFGPDGKTLAVVRSGTANGAARHVVEACSCSIHHDPAIGTVEIIALAKAAFAEAQERLRRAFVERGEGSTIASADHALTVNGAGDFAVGGPEGDNGLAGKKLVVDAYGPHVPIGGGALSGKDPHKIDRAIALRARQIAKHLVIAGVTERALVHLAFAPGDELPRWADVQFGHVSPETGTLTWTPADRALQDRWLAGYDCSIAGTFRDFGLARIPWSQLAAWGHFWDPKLPWERWSPGGSP